MNVELGAQARDRIGHYLARGGEKGRLTAKERDAAGPNFGLAWASLLEMSKRPPIW